MATVKFSIELLRTNRKSHKERINGLKKIKQNASKEYFDKMMKQHQDFYDDLTTSINSLRILQKKLRLKNKQKNDTI